MIRWAIDRAVCWVFDWVIDNEWLGDMRRREDQSNRAADRTDRLVHTGNWQRDLYQPQPKDDGNE